MREERDELGEHPYRLAAAGLRSHGGHLLPGRDRAERELRLHRSAELRAGRVHGDRRLHHGRVRRHLGTAVLARAARRARVQRGPRVPAGDSDPAAASGLPRDRDDRGLGDHPVHPGLGHPAQAVRRPGRADPLRVDVRRHEPVPLHGQPGDRVLAALRLLAAVQRLDHRRHRLCHRVPADAQPLGQSAQGHPGGRGRRTQPRQERLPVQDAVADHRRALRGGGRVLRRTAAHEHEPHLGRHRHHLLRLHRAPARRCGPGARPRGGVDHLLVPDQLPRPAVRRDDLRGPPDHPRGDHVQPAGQPAAVHHHGAGADAADDLPTSGHLRRPKGAGHRCPLPRRPAR
jgi:hypothetical protein